MPSAAFFSSTRGRYPAGVQRTRTPSTPAAARPSALRPASVSVYLPFLRARLSLSASFPEPFREASLPVATTLPSGDVPACRAALMPVAVPLSLSATLRPLRSLDALSLGTVTLTFSLAADGAAAIGSDGMPGVTAGGGAVHGPTTKAPLPAAWS